MAIEKALDKKIEREIEYLTTRIAELEARLNSNYWETQDFNVKGNKDFWVKKFIFTDTTALVAAQEKLVKLLRKINLK